MVKYGNIEVPDGVQLILSFPGKTQNEVEIFKHEIKNTSDNTAIFTNANIKVLAQNQHVIVLELYMK